MYPRHLHIPQKIQQMELNTVLLGTKDGAGTNLFLKGGKEENVITDKNLRIRGRKTKRQQRRSTVRSDTNIREDFFLPILVELCSATFAWDGGGRREEGGGGGRWERDEACEIR